jgi:hypothetical protein
MLTRKRKQIEDLQDRFLISTQPAHFDVILESVTRFLKFKDCAHVSIANRVYHCKTWKYVLSCREHSKNKIIKINQYSIPWIIKYRLFMTHQTLKMNKKNNFDLSTIPRINTLWILDVNVIIGSLPLQVKNYIFSKVIATIPNMIPNMIGTTKVEMYKSFITSHSTSVKHLDVIAEIVDCKLLPFFTNLKKLEIRCNFLRYPSLIFIQYRNLKTLQISCNDVNFITAIQSFKHTLVIISTSLMNIASFSGLQCNELDLSQCPNIIDYSAVAHIPIVRKRNQKTQ